MATPNQLFSLGGAFPTLSESKNTNLEPSQTLSKRKQKQLARELDKQVDEKTAQIAQQKIVSLTQPPQGLIDIKSKSSVDLTNEVEAKKTELEKQTQQQNDVQMEDQESFSDENSKVEESPNTVVKDKSEDPSPLSVTEEVVLEVKNENEEKEIETSSDTEEKSPSIALEKSENPNAVNDEKGSLTQQETSTSTLSPQSPKETIKVKESIPLSDELTNLNEQLSNLAADSQQAFAKQLRFEIKRISDFEGTLKANNNRYNEEYKTIKKRDEVRQEFYDLRECESVTLRQIFANCDNVKKVYSERITKLQEALEDAKKRYALEQALEKQAIEGNDSYWKNPLSMYSVGRYGAEFRLGEISHAQDSGALDIRRKNLGLKKEENSIEITENKQANFSEIQGELAKLSRHISALKEEINVYNNALTQKDTFGYAKSELAKTSYLYHRKLAEDLKAKLEDKKINELDIQKGLKTLAQERLKELDQTIEREKGRPQSSEYLNAKLERTEIAKRLEAIETRYLEITKFLEKRKIDFNLTLSETELKNSEPVKIEEFSEVQTQAFDLLNRITSLKEDVVLGNHWEQFDSLENRKVIYFQTAQQFEQLKQEKTEFEKKTMPARLNLLDTAVKTYDSYIADMRVDLQIIEKHSESLKQANKERAKWEVNPSTKV